MESLQKLHLGVCLNFHSVVQFAQTISVETKSVFPSQEHRPRGLNTLRGYRHSHVIMLFYWDTGNEGVEKTEMLEEMSREEFSLLVPSSRVDTTSSRVHLQALEIMHF